MSALYFRDFDCTDLSRAIERPDVVHEHFEREQDACLAFVRYCHAAGAEAAAGRRYRCIRGPGGLLRGVAAAGRRLFGVRDGREIWVPIGETLVHMVGPDPRLDRCLWGSDYRATSPGGEG